MSTPEGMITVQETAKRLGRSTEQVRRYLREGKLPGERIGNQWFIKEAAVAYQVETREEESVFFYETVRPKTVREMTPAERRRFVAEVESRREAIRERWEREGIEVDVVEVLREERESH